MKSLAFKLFMAVLFIPGGNLYAGNPSGELLLQSCNAATESIPDSEQMALGLYCLGLVQGVMNTHQFYQVRLENRGTWVCLPELGLTNEQGAEIVKAYLTNHPEQKSKDSSLLVSLALVDAFPCQGNER